MPISLLNAQISSFYHHGNGDAYACVFHHNATLFDIIFPRILAGESPSRKEIRLLGHGGFCHNCDPCHFPVCPFGKG